jgi:hypothetical protein
VKIRVVSWNMNARTRAKQWEALETLNPDILLLQEWRSKDELTLPGYLHRVRYSPDGRFTAVWSRWALTECDNLPTQARVPWDVYRPALDGYVASASAATPYGPISVTSVYAYPYALKPEYYVGLDRETLRLPSSKEIWPIDLVWWALRDWPRESGLALLGGDWNTARLIDVPKPRGNQEWFDRMADCGWDEIARRFHALEENVPTWSNTYGRRLQLDHFFASPALADSAVHFEVVRTPPFESASDHSPILVEFDLGG